MNEECKDCHVLAERVKQLEQRIWEKFASEKELVGAVSDGLDRRLTDLNHWHSSKIEAEKTFVTMAVYNVQHGALSNRVGAMENWQSRVVGGLILTATIMTLTGVIIGHLWK